MFNLHKKNGRQNYKGRNMTNLGIKINNSSNEKKRKIEKNYHINLSTNFRKVRPKHGLVWLAKTEGLQCLDGDGSMMCCASHQRNL